jgi:S1-C subfamily serine protease
VQPGTQPRVLRDWMRNRGGQPQGQIDTPVTPDVAPDTKDRLGVTVRDAISDDLREFLGLESGVGLMVEDVIDGTLAQRLGLVRGDVVVEVAGRKVGTSEDVRAAVQSVGSGEKVVVSINRKGKSMQVSAVKSEAAKDEAQEDEPKTRVR